MLFRFLSAVVLISIVISLPVTEKLSSKEISPSYDWLQFGGNSQHDSANYVETIITPANVSQLTMQFHVKLPDVADGVPVYLSQSTVNSASHDVLFMTTRDGHFWPLMPIMAKRFGAGTMDPGIAKRTMPAMVSLAIPLHRQRSTRTGSLFTVMGWTATFTNSR
jgi:hypothetical protein